MQAVGERLRSVAPDVAALVRAFFAPKLYGNELRFASEGAGLPSAAANLSLQYSTLDWDNATSNTLIPSTDMMCFLFCNPLRAYVQYQHNPSSASYVYDLVSRAGSTTFFVPLYQERPLFPKYATVATAYAPHGPILFPGYDDGGRYYLPVCASSSTQAFTVQCTTNPTVAGATIVRWYAWDGKHPRLIQESKSSVGNPNFYLQDTAIPSGFAYIYATILNNDPAIVGATVKMFGDYPVWAHNPVSNITTLLTQAYGIRVNLASIRVQNDASPLNRNGMVVGVTVAKSIPWQSIATGAAALSQLQNYREFVAEKGYYGIPLPDSDEDISEFYPDIAQSSIPNTTSSQMFGYPLSERRPYKAVGLTIPVTTGRSISFDVTHTIEYLTNNKLVEQKSANVSEASLRDAIVIASEQETDFENVANWRDALETVAGYVTTPSSAGLISAAINNNVTYRNNM